MSGPPEAGADEAGTLVRAAWEIRIPDGGPPVRGDLRAPRGPMPTTAIVVCHGFKGFKDWGFFPHLARALAREGHAVLTFNLSRSGIGPDGRDFSALDRFAEQTHSRNLAEIGLVLDAVSDARLFPKRPRRIGLLGHSRGGAEALLVASRDPRVDALVTWAAISHVDRYAPEQVATWESGGTVSIENARTGQRMPIGPDFWRDIRDEYERLDVLGAARRYQGPWLMVHGEDDASVPVEEGAALFAASESGLAELLRVEGAGHTFGAVHPFAGGTPELGIALEATVRWFERHLRG